MTKRTVTIKRQPRLRARVRVTEISLFEGEDVIDEGADPHSQLLRKIEAVASILDIGLEEAEHIVLGRE